MSVNASYAQGKDRAILSIRQGHPVHGKQNRRTVGPRTPTTICRPASVSATVWASPRRT